MSEPDGVHPTMAAVETARLAARKEARSRATWVVVCSLIAIVAITVATIIQHQLAEGIWPDANEWWMPWGMVGAIGISAVAVIITFAVLMVVGVVGSMFLAPRIIDYERKASAD